jgi:hypothetical protein
MPEFAFFDRKIACSVPEKAVLFRPAGSTLLSNRFDAIFASWDARLSS